MADFLFSNWLFVQLREAGSAKPDWWDANDTQRRPADGEKTSSPLTAHLATDDMAVR